MMRVSVGKRGRPRELNKGRKGRMKKKEDRKHEVHEKFNENPLGGYLPLGRGLGGMIHGQLKGRGLSTCIQGGVHVCKIQWSATLVNHRGAPHPEFFFAPGF